MMGQLVAWVHAVYVHVLLDGSKVVGKPLLILTEGLPRLMFPVSSNPLLSASLSCLCSFSSLFISFSSLYLPLAAAFLLIIHISLFRFFTLLCLACLLFSSLLFLLSCYCGFNHSSRRPISNLYPILKCIEHNCFCLFALYS